MTEDLVVVFATDSEIEAMLCRVMLQDHGIAVVERNNTVPGYPSSFMFASGRALYELLARAADAEHAARLVAQFLAEAAARDESPADDA